MTVAYATDALSPSLWDASSRCGVFTPARWAGDLCFLQQLVPVCPRWAVLVTWGFVPSTSHAHTKKRKLEVEKRELFGFWRVSVLHRVLAWGAVAGRGGVGPAGTGGGDGDPAPSQPGWCWGMRPLTMLKEEGWLEPDHDVCCCGLGCGAVSCERDSSMGTAGIAWEPARMGRGAISLTRAGGPNVPLAGNRSLFSQMFFKLCFLRHFCAVHQVPMMSIFSSHPKALHH